MSRIKANEPGSALLVYGDEMRWALQGEDLLAVSESGVEAYLVGVSRYESFPGRINPCVDSFELTTVVVDEEQVAAVLALCPDTWGVQCMGGSGCDTGLQTIRSASSTAPERLSVLGRLLWRDEVAAILTRQGLRVPALASRAQLLSVLTSQQTAAEARSLVVAQILLRAGRRRDARATE